MSISQIDIQTLLPQKRPFVMVDRLMESDLTITRTEFLVQKENIFSEGGVLTESGVIENIAQTCAARMGYLNSVMASGEVKMGFIGSIKNLTIHKLPKVGDLMETQIEVLSEVFNITLVGAKVLVGNELIADCEMKISEQ